MARSEDYGQGRTRTRRPYDDQDLADRRPASSSSTYSADRSDPPTQRRGGTSYQPQFDRYVAQPAPEAPRAAAPVQPQPVTGRAARPPARGQAAGYGYAAEPPAPSWDDQGYGQEPAADPYAQPARSSFGTRQPAHQAQAPAYDPRAQQTGYGYDQGQQGYGYDQGQAAEAGYGAQDDYAQQGYGQQQGYAQQGQYGYDNQGYPQPQQGYGYPDQQGYDDQGYAQDDQILANGEYVETEEPALAPASKSRRGLIVAAAFVAAVLIGGGLGFVYKMTSETSFSSGDEVPVLAADTEPTKTVPEEATADEGSSKSIYDRLNDNGESNGDGTSQATLGESAETVDIPKGESDANVQDTEPIMQGMTFADQGDGNGGAASDEAAGTVEASAAEAQPKIRKVEVRQVKPGELIVESGDQTADITQAVDTTASAPAEVTEPAAPALDGQALVTTPKKKKKTQTAAEQVAALAEADQQPQAAQPAAEPTAKATGSGYVVQAGVAQSSAEALAKFADLQQAHSGLLGSSEPAIKKSDKGFRILIGPPSSKQAASTLCTKLKAAGTDCFIRQY